MMRKVVVCSMGDERVGDCIREERRSGRGCEGRVREMKKKEKESVWSVIR